MKELPPVVIALVKQLEQQAKLKRYDSLVDSLWFLYHVLNHPSITAMPMLIKRIVVVATRVLPIIDQQVQCSDLDIEFRNHLHRLGQALYSLSLQDLSIDDLGYQTELKNVLQSMLQAKPARPRMWSNWTTLDWQSQSSSSSHSTMKTIIDRRLWMRQRLNQEVNNTSKHTDTSLLDLDFTMVWCCARMLLAYFSTLIYSKKKAGESTNTVLDYLAPLTQWLDTFLPQLHTQQTDLGWEIVHIYLYWLRDRPTVPKSVDQMINLLKVTLQSRQPTATLITLSVSAHWITGNIAKQQPDTVLGLCDLVLQLQTRWCNSSTLTDATGSFGLNYRHRLQHARSQWKINDPIASQREFSRASIELMQMLFGKAVQIMGQPPGKMALLLLGSSSRFDRLPYSDIELAMLYEAPEDQASKMRAYLYSLLSLIELFVIRLGETQDFTQQESAAGFHLDSSDHILSLEKQLIGTVDELYQHHIESILAHMPGALIVAGDLGAEGKGQLLYALLTPYLVNEQWGGEQLFSQYQQRITMLLNSEVDRWTQQVFLLACQNNHCEIDKEHQFHLQMPNTQSTTQPSTSPSAALTVSYVDFEEINESTQRLSYRQCIALYCWIDVLRSGQRALSTVSAEQKPINIKDAYHKPLIYLALNIQLFLNSRAEHPYDMFEYGYKSGILSYGVKILLQIMQTTIVRLRSELHLDKQTQEERLLRESLSKTDQLTLQIIANTLYQPLQRAIEALLSKKQSTAFAWKKALRQAFDQVWIHYSKARQAWQLILPNHPLLTCLIDFPGPDGKKPRIDHWLSSKSQQLKRLCLAVNDPLFKQAKFKKLPRMIIERTVSQQRLPFALHPQASLQLLKKHIINDKGQLLFSNQQISQEKGRHLVVSVTIPLGKGKEKLTVYLKIYPEMPIMEWAVTELALLISHCQFPWVEFVRLTAAGKVYPVLLSQGVVGQLLNHALTSQQAWQVDPWHYSHRLMLSLLLNQEDAKPSNFIAQNASSVSVGHASSVKHIIGLTCIDNDRSFYPSLTIDNRTQQVLPIVKDITYCFDQMQQVIHPLVRESWLSLDAYQVLSLWLMIMQRNAYQIDALFTLAEIKQYFPKKGVAQQWSRLGRVWSGNTAPEDSVLTFTLKSGVISVLYTKIMRLQNFICFVTLRQLTLTY